MEGDRVEQRLLNAIEASDIEALQAALSEPGNVNWAHDDGFGQGLLNRAVELGDLDAITLILQSIPADSLQNIRDSSGGNAAHFAVLSRQPAVVTAVVNHSPRTIAAADSSGCLPIHWAAAHGAPAVILAALSSNSPDFINAIDESGMTPLHHAATMNRLEAARWLVNSGAKIDLPDKSGRTAKDIAEQRSYLDFVELCAV